MSVQPCAHGAACPRRGWRTPPPPATKNGATIRRGATHYKAKINKNQLQSTPVNSRSKKIKAKSKSNKQRKGAKKRHFASVKRDSLSCAHSKGALIPPPVAQGTVGVIARRGCDASRTSASHWGAARGNWAW